jgi:hypothetical protein
MENFIPKENPFYWYIFMGILILACIMNIYAGYLMWFNKEVKKTAQVAFIKYLVVEDFLYSLLCLLYCLFNSIGMHFSSNTFGCRLQAISVQFFVMLTAWTLVFVAYATETIIVSKACIYLGEGAFKYHLVVVPIMFCLTILCVYNPGHAVLNNSQSYCLADFRSIWNSFIFLGIGILPAFGYMIYKYYKVWRFLKAQDESQVLIGAGLSSQHEWKILTRFSSFIIVFFICHFGFFGGSFYSLATGDKMSKEFDLITGIGSHSNSLLNPILYIYLSPVARKAVKFDLRRSASRLSFLTVRKEDLA